MQIPEHFNRSPNALWKNFFEMTQIPRPSKEEDKIRDWVIAKAVAYNCEYKVDKAGNIIIYTQGGGKYKEWPPILIQNHLDMVCDAIPDKKINFSTDPIITFEKEGWIYADGTTLGADNGIGCAAAMALLEEKDSLPPLEILFTIDEETGLHGALNLDPSFYKAKTMLNLDTEDWGIIFVGCAGGYDLDFTGKFQMEKINEDTLEYALTIKGLIGGHSGCDIHMDLGNSIIFLASALKELTNLGARVTHFEAGRAHNIIPRDGIVRFMLNREDEDEACDIIQTCLDDLQESWKLEKNTEVFLDQIDTNPETACSLDDSKKLADILLDIPHGARTFDESFDEKVTKLSSNLAKAIFSEGELYILCSLRFFNQEDVEELQKSYDEVEQKYSLNMNVNNGYPAWSPVLESDIVQIVKEEYKKQVGEEAKVTAIHAGLECGILKEKLPEMDMVSFGPDIRGAHSPTERVEVESVEKFWILLLNVLRRPLS